MSDERMTKDLFSIARLKAYAKSQRDGGGTCNVNPEVLVALIDATECLQVIYLQLLPPEQARALKALKKLDGL